MDQALKEKEKIRKAALTLGPLLLITHFIIKAHNWYHTIPWVDIPQHIAFGIFAALTFYWLSYYFPNTLNLEQNPRFTLLLVLGWTALLGVIWEVIEFIHDGIVLYFGFHLQLAQLSNFDTMKDLVDDLIGGFSLAILMRLRYDKRKRQL